MQKTEYKTIFSLKVKLALQQRGIMPVLEKPNRKFKDLLCWVYINTPELQVALDQIWGEANGS